MPEPSQFDVFLCHNSQDKPEVIKIAETLKQQGLKPWLDVWELRPGLPWQRELERQIEHIKAAAVFVGGSGIGPWQEMEIEAYLRCFVKKGSPVIPVLLPNAPKKPELPIFLEGMTWVDFRGSHADPMGQFIWGITGIRPSDFKPSSPSQPEQVKEKIPTPPRERKPPRVSRPVTPYVVPELPRIPPPSVEINRRKLLQWIGWAGAGVGATIIGRAAYQSATQPNSSTENKLIESTFEFETLTVNSKGEEISRNRKQAEYFTEDLGNGVKFEMVVIPGGTFTMGAPATEAESTDDERPQHQVTVPAFSMGKFQGTQKLWKAVASLPKIERELKLDPSRFKGDNRPVENISWYDAVEFCKRLSKKTGREYRLPSESEWEYSCRAGTTTPFYFGETITTDLVNFNGNYTYGNAPKGIFREETTPVGQFPPNAFGLYDMHGNVWEWCADHWHDNYKGAPTNGSAWLSENDYRLLRGGSWPYNPWDCRSARRYWFDAGFDYPHVGLRLACGAART